MTKLYGGWDGGRDRVEDKMTMPATNETGPMRKEQLYYRWWPELRQHWPQHASLKCIRPNERTSAQSAVSNLYLFVCVCVCVVCVFKYVCINMCAYVFRATKSSQNKRSSPNICLVKERENVCVVVFAFSFVSVHCKHIKRYGSCQASSLS